MTGYGGNYRIKGGGGSRDYRGFYVRMRVMLSDALREAGIINDDAVSMLYAAAVGSLETGGIGE